VRGDGTWTVHGFEAKLLLLDVEVKHVLLVVLGMARRFPEVEIENVGSHHLLVLVFPVLLPDILQSTDPIKLEQLTPAFQLSEHTV
jgi:hypothetical protein